MAGNWVDLRYTSTLRGWGEIGTERSSVTATPILRQLM